MKDLFTALSAVAAVIAIADYLDRRAKAGGEVQRAVDMSGGVAPAQGWWRVSGSPENVTSRPARANAGQWEKYGVLMPYSI